MRYRSDRGVRRSSRSTAFGVGWASTPIVAFRLNAAEALVEVSALRLEHEVPLDDLVPWLVASGGQDVAVLVIRSREVELVAKDGKARPVHVCALRKGSYVVFVSGTCSDSEARRDVMIAVADFRPLTPRHRLVEALCDRAVSRLHFMVPNAWSLTTESAVTVRLDAPRTEGPCHLSVGGLEDAPSPKAAITSMVTSLEARGLTYPSSRIVPAPPSLAERTARTE